jgi:hypothetical protein
VTTKTAGSPMQARARAFAQELVLFGRLPGFQWDGLAGFLVLFAEAELARKAREDAARALTKE